VALPRGARRPDPAGIPDNMLDSCARSNRVRSCHTIMTTARQSLDMTLSGSDRSSRHNLATQRANYCVASADGARIAHFGYIRPAQHGRIIHYGYIDDKLYGVVGSATFAACVAHLAIITAGRRDPP